MRLDYKRHRAQSAFEKNLAYCRGEIQRQSSTRRQLAPVLEYLYYLVEDCGPATLLTQRYHRDLEELATQIERLTPHPPVPARPRLRVVK